MTLRTVALVGTALLIAACARNEPMAGNDLGQPIYAKDGMTVVGYSNDMDGDGMADSDMDGM